MLSKLRNNFSAWQIATSVAVFLLLTASAFFVSNVELPPSAAIISSVNVLLMAVPAFIAATYWLGRRDAIMLFVAFAVLALAIETFAIFTGFPYGRFSYSDAVGYKLFGVTPWTIAFAWTPLVLAAYTIPARSINSIFLRVPVVVILLLAFDAVLDPGAVRLGFWNYQGGGEYYGVPLSNYFGWAVSGAIGAVVMEIFVALRKPLLPVPVHLISSAYIGIFFWTFVAVFTGMSVPALAGAIVLIGMTFFSYAKYYAFDDMLVIVDENNVPIRTAPKLATHDGDTPLHRAFSVFIFDAEGKLLLQQRALSKKTWPGVWSNSCCGHVMLHENLFNAAARRLKYELGIANVQLKLILPNFRYRAEKDGVVENELCPVLVGSYMGKVNPNATEVNATRWVNWTDFTREVQDPANDYSPWAINEVMLLNQSELFKSFLLSEKSNARLSDAIRAA